MNKHHPDRLALGCLLAWALYGCGSPGSSGTDESSAAGAGSVSTAGVCGLLTLSEVQAVFPAVRVNAPEERLAKDGIRACDWGNAPGGRSLQVRLSNSTVDDEIGMFEMGVLDPVKAPPPLEREPITGAGDGGAALVAKQDTAAGVLQSVGVAAIQKGKQTLVVVSSEIAGRADDEATTGLSKLAQAAIARVN